MDRSKIQDGDVPMPSKMTVFIVGGIITLALLIGGVMGFILYYETVDEGEVGVVKDKGSATGETWEPGWHRYSFPGGLMTESVAKIDVRPQTYTMSGDIHEGDVEADDAIDFLSNDQQRVSTDITIRYRVKSDHAPDFYSEFATHNKFQDDIVRPTTDEIVPREASEFDAIEAETEEGREQIGEAVLEQMQTEAPDSVEIEAVNVRDVHLDPDYVEPLEDVERAQAEADAQRERSEGQADADRIEAEGEADAIETIREELTEEVLIHEQIDAYDSGTVFVVDPSTQSIIQAESSDDSSLFDDDWGDDGGD